VRRFVIRSKRYPLLEYLNILVEDDEEIVGVSMFGGEMIVFTSRPDTSNPQDYITEKNIHEVGKSIGKNR
jgi:hypothetical protein